MPAEERRTARDVQRPPLVAPTGIRLVPLHPEPPSQSLMRWLADELEARLSTAVEIAEPLEFEPGWRAAEDGQLSSSAIVDSLMTHFPIDQGGPVVWVLAVATSDLRAGGRDYVFGEAAFGGAWAVVSTARLGAAGEPRFRSRLLREALHELGHLAGLPHCKAKNCLMTPAVTVEDIDAVGMEHCPRCEPVEGT